ncbi:hypothetical protein TWF718_000574 [Orbilia javanica]|uniref:CCHC-type domain-containing protein n=1 Tax=Orbilia javanica TaxID=47235 RepID=A0AAN8RMD0_9PEZI
MWILSFTLVGATMVALALTKWRTPLEERMAKRAVKMEIAPGEDNPMSRPLQPKGPSIATQKLIAEAKEVTERLRQLQNRLELRAKSLDLTGNTYNVKPPPKLSGLTPEPGPEAGTFPTEEPKDGYRGAEPPWEFDDDKTKWRDWTTEMLLWARSNELRNRWNALSQFAACIKEGTRAKGRIRYLMHSVHSETPEKEAFEKLDNTIQVWEWCIRVLAPGCRDWGEESKAIRRLTTYQRGKPVREILDNVAYATKVLGLDPARQTEAFRMNIRKDLQLALAQRLGKWPSDLTLSDFIERVEGVENEQKIVREGYMNWTPKPNFKGSAETQREKSVNTRATNAPDERKRQNHGVKLWSDEDWALIKEAGACFNCGWANHRTKDCKKPREGFKTLSQESTTFLRERIERKKKNGWRSRGQKDQQPMVLNSDCKNSSIETGLCAEASSSPETVRWINTDSDSITITGQIALVDSEI